MSEQPTADALGSTDDAPARTGGGRRPVIGLTTYVEPASRGEWTGVPSALLPANYVQHVRAAGGIVVLVPPEADVDDSVVDEILDRLDGLILTGGVDIAPERYAAQPHPSIQAPRPDRDSMELALARRARERDMPLLGICRGMQVMAVEAGGTIEQHIPDRTGTTEHSPTPGAFSAHEVTAVEGTRIGGILGTEPLVVPTYHHQAVATHPGYEAAAWAPDGTLEAMEDPTGAFRLAVQWHPEAGEDPRLFDALVEAARAAYGTTARSADGSP